MEVRGQIAVTIKSKGKAWPTFLYFSNADELRDLLSYCVDKNIEPISLSSGSISLIPTTKQTSHLIGEGCPEHGTGKLKPDANGKGLYCSAKTNGGYCSRKSWKEWKT